MEGNAEQKEYEKNNDKPALLKAIEIILANPADIKKEALDLYNQYENKYKEKTPDEIRLKTSKKMVSNYSYFTSFIGGATSLTGVIPGLGQAIAIVGGASADAALSMKYQIEMTMAIATIYEHDIELEEEKRLCLIIAGLGAINEAAKEGGKSIGTKAFIKMAQQYLKGSTLTAVKEIFKKVGVTFTRKALEKSIPFGVGVIIGATANKGLTVYIGSKAIDFFRLQ